MPVNRRNDTDAVCCKFPLFPPHNLRYTQRIFFYLLRNIQDVACAGEIEYHSASPSLHHCFGYAIIRLLLPIDTTDYILRLLQPVKRFFQKDWGKYRYVYDEASL